jgi:hypothetical protein
MSIRTMIVVLAGMTLLALLGHQVIEAHAAHITACNQAQKGGQ